MISDQLDGNSTSQLLRLLKIDFEMRVALDEMRLSRALKVAHDDNFDVIHISCHGDDKGIQLSDRKCIDWGPLASLFSKTQGASACVSYVGMLRCL